MSNVITIRYRNEYKSFDLGKLSLLQIDNLQYWINQQCKRIQSRLYLKPVLPVKAMCKLTSRLGRLQDNLNAILSYLTNFN